jgi:nitroreductase
MDWFMSTPLGRLKARLQWTGWLQYVGPVAPAVLLLLIAGVDALIGFVPWVLVWPPLLLGALILLIVAVDLVTVRWDLRPRESHPPRLDGLDAFGVMRARRSNRSFQSRDLDADDRDALLGWAEQYTRPEALLGTGPIRLEYVALPLTVWPVVRAHEFLVAIVPHAYDRTAVIDVGRSLQKVVIEATRAGISTCWIGPGADQSSVVAGLGDRFDPEGDHVICVCAVGYKSRFIPLLIRGMNRLMHRRRPLEDLFFADPDLAQPVDVTKAPYDEFGRCFEVCQWSPSSYNGQTTRATLHGGDVLDRVDFGCSTSSHYYAPVAVGIWVANWEIGCEALGIHGRTTILPASEREMTDGPGLPRYGATWLRDGAEPT